MGRPSKAVAVIENKDANSYPMAEVEIKEGEVSKAGAKYSYPLDMAGKAARLNPRNEQKVFDGAIMELSIVPDLAAEAYYSIPFKKKMPNGEWETVPVEGLSIKAAMALARRWGNSINSSHIREELDDRLICEGVYIDAETNTWTMRTVAAEKFYTDRKTGLKSPIRADALVKAIGSAQSKAVRNAILSTLPAWLTKAYFEEAKRLAAGGAAKIKSAKPTMSAEERMEWLNTHFPKVGVTVEVLNVYIKAEMADMSLEDRIGGLVGIFNALKDGQAKPEDVFGPYMKKSEPVNQADGPVTGGKLWPGDTGSL